MMNRLIPICTALLLTSSVTLAAPTVTGNVISWPDDGWYQVQDEATYQEVCAGTRSCTVEPGRYVVINHSTGERFEGIEVTGAGTSDSPVVVTGNVISWPDDGWYQVQRADDFSEVCAGGSSCEVEPGVYTVINHTTMTRYESVRVGDATPEGPDQPDSGFLPASLTEPLLATIGTGSPLSVSNYATFLPAFYRVAGTQLLEHVSSQVQAIQDELRAARAGESSRFVAESVTAQDDATDEIVFTCPGGGRVKATLAREESGSYLNRATMDFTRCQIENDTLSGMASGSLPTNDGSDTDGTDTFQNFGGFQFERTRYPFAEPIAGFGSANEQFTIEADSGIRTTIYAGALRFMVPAVSVREWRGNWRIESPEADLVVKDMIVDNSSERRSLNDNIPETRLRPYFSMQGTVTNDRRIGTIALGTMYALGNRFTSVSQALTDAQGGILGLTVAQLEEGGGDPPFIVRIDTEGTVLEQSVPQDDNSRVMLFDN